MCLAFLVFNILVNHVYNELTLRVEEWKMPLYVLRNNNVKCIKVYIKILIPSDMTDVLSVFY